MSKNCKLLNRYIMNKAFVVYHLQWVRKFQIKYRLLMTNKIFVLNNINTFSKGVCALYSSPESYRATKSTILFDTHNSKKICQYIINDTFCLVIVFGTLNTVNP